MAEGLAGALGCHGRDSISAADWKERRGGRVGTTQDLAALDIDLAAITQAGGWNSTRMPLQYAETINAARSGMARAAAAAGRDQAGNCMIHTPTIEAKSRKMA